MYLDSMGVFDKLKLGSKPADDEFMNLPTAGIGAPGGALGPAGGTGIDSGMGLGQLPSPTPIVSSTGNSASSQMQLINKIDILTNKIDTLISEIEMIKQKLTQVESKIGQQATPQQPQSDQQGYGQQQSSSAFGSFQTQQPAQQPPPQQPQANWQSPW
jgi:hypothetical protein